MPSPRLSIGLPVFNGERYLPAAIGSLLAQDFGDFELIIADNASEDRTAEMARAFAATDDRIRYHRHSHNRGAAANYNFTVEEARGEYFKWAAHDDVCRPGYLSACVARLDAEPDVVLCHSRSEAIDSRGRRLGLYADEPDALDPRPWRRFARMMLQPHYCIPVFGVMRRTVLLQTPRHGDWVGADRNLLAELALHGRIALVEAVLFQRRHHAESSITRLPDERQRAAWFRPDPGRRTYPTWRRGLEYLRSVRRAPLSLAERWACRGQWLRWVFGRHHTGERNLTRMLGELRPSRAR